MSAIGYSASISRRQTGARICRSVALVFGVFLFAGNFRVWSGDARLPDKTPATILVAAAASLERVFVDELIPCFQRKHPDILVEGTYDSSGKLQTQIENGLEADVFVSAAAKQMGELRDRGFIDAAGVADLLENKVVLIRSAASTVKADDFVQAADAGVLALGDPDSVPAGQYAREIFTSLGVWDKAKERASFGTNVTEVLNWVAEGSADLGVVYATDAASTGKVAVVCEAPPGSLKRKVVYPVGVLSGSKRRREADAFVEFLKSEEAASVFAKYGFSPNAASRGTR